MKQINAPLKEIWFSSEHGQINIIAGKDGNLLIDFWDFISDVYEDDKGPAKELIIQKREVAIELHCALVKECDALLSYTLAFTDKNTDSYWEKGEEFATLFRKKDYLNLDRMIDKELYIWLIAIKSTDDFQLHLMKDTSASYHTILTKETFSLYEHKEYIPDFLYE